MIDKSKQYKTRDGREVRIYATDGVMPYPVHGAVKSKDGWCRAAWTMDGDEGLREYDLIEVRPRIKRTVWLNVYRNHETVRASKKEADYDCFPTRLACVKVEIDCEEGEGL